MGLEAKNPLTNAVAAFDEAMKEPTRVWGHFCSLLVSLSWNACLWSGDRTTLGARNPSLGSLVVGKTEREVHSVPSPAGQLLSELGIWPCFREHLHMRETFGFKDDACKGWLRDLSPTALPHMR